MAPFKLYTFSTPNGYKASVTLEQLNLEYEVIEVNIFKGEHHAESFAKINPDQKIPFLVDEEKGVTVSQSGAIVEYLVENYDTQHKLGYPPRTKEHALETELLFFESTEMTPPLSSALSLKYWSSEKIPQALEKHITEVKRVYATLEKYLERNQQNGLFFVGDRYCACDIGIAGWLSVAPALEIDIAQYSLLSAWHGKYLEIPAVKKGMAVPGKMEIKAQ